MSGNNESWEIFINIEISTHLLPCGGWFCPVSSEPVEPYFTRFLRVLSFCLEASKIVFFLRKWCSRMQEKICHRGEKEQMHESEETIICCYINRILKMNKIYI